MHTNVEWGFWLAKDLVSLKTLFCWDNHFVISWTSLYFCDYFLYKNRAERDTWCTANWVCGSVTCRVRLSEMFWCPELDWLSEEMLTSRSWLWLYCIDISKVRGNVIIITGLHGLNNKLCVSHHKAVFALSPGLVPRGNHNLAVMSWLSFLPFVII